MPGFNLDEYMQVKDRIPLFYQKYPAGRIIPSVIEHDREVGFILMKAEVYRFQEDMIPAAVGHAFEERSMGHINPKSYVENCETSAVGRALGLLNMGIEKAIASQDEMKAVQDDVTQSNDQTCAEIRKEWELRGGTEVTLQNWVMEKNGGLQLEELTGNRQAYILSVIKKRPITVKKES